MTSHAPPRTSPSADLKAIPLPDVAKQLASSPDGLTQAEAQKRLAQCGPNELAEKRTNAFLKFLTYFWGPIPWTIEGAVVLSGVVRHWSDLVIISVLLVSNAVVGFWEEHQAGNAIAALKSALGKAKRPAHYLAIPPELFATVIQNHVFQIVALLAMEPPVGRNYGAVHDEKARVFRAMRPLTPRDLVRGQYAGYRKEPNVARDSDVETYCAVRPFIDSWRWDGVPWYLRSGKCLPETAAEVLVELKAPPARLFADSAPTAGPTNYLRFRLSPHAAVALAGRVKRPGKEFAGDQRELYLVEETLGVEPPYQRLLSDAMIGDGALFTREDAIEAAWAAVDPVLRKHSRVLPSRRGTWGPQAADALIAPSGGWLNPTSDETT